MLIWICTHLVSFVNLYSSIYDLWYFSDVTGVEIAGALKNVLAIASGIVEGMNLGNNCMAALVAQGCSEIRWLATKVGSQSAMSITRLLPIASNSTYSSSYKLLPYSPFLIKEAINTSTFSYHFFFLNTYGLSSVMNNFNNKFWFSAITINCCRSMLSYRQICFFSIPFSTFNIWVDKTFLPINCCRYMLLYCQVCFFFCSFFYF